MTESYEAGKQCQQTRNLDLHTAIQDEIWKETEVIPVFMESGKHY